MQAWEGVVQQLLPLCSLMVHVLCLRGLVHS